MPINSMTLKIDNKELRRELNHLAVYEKPTPRLVEILYMMHEARRVNYHNIEDEFCDMALLALLHDSEATIGLRQVRGGIDALRRNWNPTSNTSAFAYVTQVINNMFNNAFIMRDHEYQAKMRLGWKPPRKDQDEDSY